MSSALLMLQKQIFIVGEFLIQKDVSVKQLWHKFVSDIVVS